MPFTFAVEVRAEAGASERALAEALFRQAKQLMTEGRIAEACSKFAESHRLDPGGGTLLNLAVCHEKDGRIATAWAEFKDALAYARSEGRVDRAELAQSHISELEPLLPELAVVVAANTCEAELTISIDGVALGKAAWGTPMPLDPGGHVVLATCLNARERAPRTWSKRVELAPKASLRVDVPRFPAAAAPVVTPQVTESVVFESPDPGRSQRAAGYVGIGVGASALLLGTYFGIKAVDQSRESKEACSANACDARALSLNEDARQNARLSNISLGVGLVTAAVGTWLVLSAPSKSERPASVRRASLRFDAFANPSGGMCTLERAF